MSEWAYTIQTAGTIRSEPGTEVGTLVVMAVGGIPTAGESVAVDSADRSWQPAAAIKITKNSEMTKSLILDKAIR
jgi:hypothetical protein